MKTFGWIMIIIIIIIGGWWFFARPAISPAPTVDDLNTTATSSVSNPTDLASQVSSTTPADKMSTSTKTTGDLAPLSIKIDSGAFYFKPNVIKAKVGQLIQLKITSKGTHTFSLDEFKVNVDTPNGQTTLVEFTPTKKGTFEFYCNTPGHRQSGQVGTLIVE